MLDVQLYYCNISSFLYTRPRCWATDKAIDPMFQLRAFNFFFVFFCFSFSSIMECHTALLQSLLILEQNRFSCSFLLDVRSETF